MNNHSDIQSILNDLIETCRNGEESFRSAYESIQNNEFRRLFNIFSQQRAQFVLELRAEAHRIGGASGQNPEPIERKTPGRAAAEMPDEASIVAACQRAEEAAAHAYELALRADLPLDIQYVVKRQSMDIKDAYDRIRIMQRAA